MSLGVPEAHGLRKQLCFTWVSSLLISESFEVHSYRSRGVQKLSRDLFYIQINQQTEAKEL